MSVPNIVVTFPSCEECLAKLGKAILLEVVAMTAGLIARFSTELGEGEQAPYGEDLTAQEKD